MNNQNSYKLASWLGYLFVEEVDAVQSIAEKLPPNPITANIGAGGGLSALCVAEARPDAVIYSVDISPGGPLGGLEGERNAFDAAGIKYPNQILGNSHEVGKTWVGDKFDLIFIDADHTSFGVRGDIGTWSPHLKPGGYLAFHDYERDFWPDVKVAVDELIVPNYKLISHVRTFIAFQSLIPKEEKNASDKTGRIVKPRTKSGIQSRK